MNECSASPASGGVVRSRAARTAQRASASWNMSEASGAAQAATSFAKASENKPPCGSEGFPPPIPVPRGGSAAREACPNPPKNGPFSSVADPDAPFVPILPQDVAAYIPAAKIFRSLGSKTDPILHVQFTRLWGIVAQNRRSRKWRREWDSNPRGALHARSISSRVP